MAPFHVTIPVSCTFASLHCSHENESEVCDNLKPILLACV